jgi:purine-nucleoside phosphorylase
VTEAQSCAVRFLHQWLGPRQPSVALILGSGLGELAAMLAEPMRRSYEEIPGFPSATVPGHMGELVAGRLGGREVLIQSGRFHGYEGHGPEVIALPLRAFAEVGVRTVLLTNAAGGIRRTFCPGTLMLIADQVNLTFRNTLVGPACSGEERFPDMSDPYDRELRRLAHRVAVKEGIALEEGVYAGVVGPSYETPAEIRMLERLGADAVGMSTVLEVVTARARGIRCLGISTITNQAAGLGAAPLSHVEVMRTAERTSERIQRLLAGIVARLEE